MTTRKVIRTPVRWTPWLHVRDFLPLVHWIDGTPILAHIEPYRLRIMEDVLDTASPDGSRHYNMAVLGRAKKNFKSADLVVMALFCLLANDSPGGNGVYLLANDEGQAGDDLTLAKLIVAASPELAARITVQAKVLKRKDGKGQLEILPAQDILGSHGKTYRASLFDEIHGYKDWALLEALQLDPHRGDAQMIITSYASLFHKPGAPLYDLLQQGKAGRDPRFYLSWYGADYSTDPAAQDLTPEERANPSRATFAPGYLAQQQQRLPSHLYRRLHLNLGGLPEGSAFTVEMVQGAIDRGVRVRPPQPGLVYFGFVDPSGGSRDAYTGGVAHVDADGHAVVDAVVDQGTPCPFNPRHAVRRLCSTFRTYGITQLWGDRFGGNTFAADFWEAGYDYQVVDATKHQLYALAEPHLNAGTLHLVEHPELEQQLLGLRWRGGKIDHAPNEHDDHANAALGACLIALTFGGAAAAPVELSPDDLALERSFAAHMGYDGVAQHPDFVPDDTGQHYANRDMRWSRINADGSRTPLW
jgi:hypothetical protein